MKTRVFYYRLSALLLFALLLAYQLYKVFHTALWNDGAVFANVPKNMLGGQGYAIADYDKIVTFHPGISVGPVIILPLWVVMAFFGNTFWTPALGSVLILTVLLILVFLQARKLAARNPEIYWQIALVFLVTAPLITQGNVSVKEQYMQPWHTPLGEIPSALFTLIAVCFIMARPRTPANLFCCGLIAGLSGLCKLQTLIGAGALGLYLAALEFAAISPGKNRLRSISGLFLCALGMILPLCLFELVKIISLGSVEQYLQLVKLQMRFIHEAAHSQGIEFKFARIGLLGICLGVMPSEGYSALGMALSIGIFTALLFAAIYSFLYACRTRHISSLRAAGGALLFCGGVYLLWWVCVCSINGMRYSIPGLIYLCFSGALFIADIATENARKAMRIILFVLAAVLIIKRDSVVYLAESITPDAYLQETLDTRNTLIAIRRQNPDTLFFSCSNAFEMDYLLPGPSNFRSCDQMFDAQYAGRPRVLLTVWPVKGKIWSFYPGSILGYSRYTPVNVRQYCPKDDIYAGERYLIASCRTP